MATVPDKSGNSPASNSGGEAGVPEPHIPSKLERIAEAEEANTALLTEIEANTEPA